MTLQRKLGICVVTGLLLTFASACSVEADSKKPDAPGTGDAFPDLGGGGGDATDDEQRKDDYQGVYKVTSQMETKFFTCDEEEPASGTDKLDFVKLDTYWNFSPFGTDERKFELWLHKCLDEKTCETMMSNYMFRDKVEGAWGGPSSTGIGDSYEVTGKCSFQYQERSAKLVGTDLVIVSTYFSGDVAALGNGICGESKGGDKTNDDYYAEYKGKLPCHDRETIRATKLDVPLPE